MLRFFVCDPIPMPAHDHAPDRFRCSILTRPYRGHEWRMPMTESRLRVSKINEITQVEFVDRNILDEANIQAISDEITGIIEQSTTPQVLINFANVDHLSSAALGALITINNKANEKDGKLRLANIDPQIYEVFVITRLNKLFSIHDTLGEAVEQFNTANN